MDDHDIKRVSRLTAIITQLQAGRLVTAPQLSRKFGVSLRTIYRISGRWKRPEYPSLWLKGKAIP